VLRGHTGSILDVGGGVAPYCGASHILDRLPFSRERLAANAWPDAAPAREWDPAAYTELDLCAGESWPFDTNQFDLGLSSHCLEDLRDPLPAAKELARVCRSILIICPSRLLEQTRGIEHPRFCGFPHHPWMVTAEGERLVFRRKTPILELAGAHLTCPFGHTLRVNDGSMYFYGERVRPEEQVFWSPAEDHRDYCKFIKPFRKRSGLFAPGGCGRVSTRLLIWRLRQRWLGVL